MKVRNVRIRGGSHPVFACPCGSQIDPQAKGKKPAVGTTLYCGYDCGHYAAIMPKK